MNIGPDNPKHFYMIKNYFKSALRNLWKNKTSSLINITGLSAGLSCCLLIALYIQSELSYDEFQEKGDRIARVIMEYSFGGDVRKGNFTSTKVAPSFKRNFPEIESAVKMSKTSRVVRYDDKLINEKNFYYADSSFFSIFSFKLLNGSRRQVLKDSGMVVLTASTAKKYFGSQDPIGKIIKVGSDEAGYMVTGIVQDCPSNSQIKFDFVASFSTLGVDQQETYWEANYTTYLLLRDKKAMATLQDKIPGFMKKEMPPVAGTYIKYHLEPFKAVHLYSDYEGFEPNNSIAYIYIIAAVALLILAIACFTYINLSTARSMERAREVGVRKVIGALQKQIFWQFIGESVFTCLVSLCISFFVVAMVMPFFNELAEKQLTVSSLFTPYTALSCFFIVCCISLLAGSYPALILSGFKPVKALKNPFRTHGSGLWLRKSLIVFQFVISVFLIAATLIIRSQLHYIQNKKLGYERDHVLVLPLDTKMLNNISTIKTEFKANDHVVNVSWTVSPPTHIYGGYNMSKPGMPEGVQLSVFGNPVDEEFIQTTGMEIIAGSDLSQQDIQEVADSAKNKIYHFLLNESAVAALGWKPQEAIGKKMFLDKSRPGFVKGIVKDFNFESLHNAVKPLVLFPEIRGSVMLVKIKGNTIAQTISFLETKWKQVITHRPFEYHFMDEDYNNLYSSEIRLGKVLNLFAGIAILLACLGLFGLSSYAAQQRIKEIGIRKVLGASTGNLVMILSNDFIKLSLIAVIIATPVAWWSMSKWLEDFSYRITMNWITFAFAGIVAVAIAFCTVGSQAIKAAMANPVKALRSE
ncbi:MAG: macB 17 [Chitinophagaceae bacterium]|nr:macB 17 [Chitinophagaceae bacterium]